MHMPDGWTGLVKVQEHMCPCVGHTWQRAVVQLRLATGTIVRLACLTIWELPHSQARQSDNSASLMKCCERSLGDHY
eukprot:jgi/Botrbrau1/2506/Bobra.0226s0060.1